ncbi:glycosyltransferase family 4 protein [Sphingomonas sp. C8-2]|jgi:hypothetical protein|uniref:hypothetical protein n=1 Tax=Rhizorhabdus histidinilytica TaxID=439228 RepID=UPI000F791708|nr:glycosyltransferase family 4 protein [Sphingomonas sp. C8-2]
MNAGLSTGQPRRLLIATNHLQHLAGSEVVALETAQHFAARGCDITVFANWAAAPMAELVAAATGTPVITDPNRIRPFSYDMAYVQHQVLGLFDYRPGDDERPATRIVAGRLSRRSYLESGGWLHDRILVDHVLANSALTAEHLARVGYDAPTTVFHNAAPDDFFRPFTEKPAIPRRILVVSNHLDPALADAMMRLRPDITVDHVGEAGGRVTLVTPAMIAGADLVISIGKTVPYALASHVPVYVYDHFGGPGYLDADNVDAAARYNFSGRCCERRLSGAQIAAEIVGSYAKGVAFAREPRQAWLERFRQPPYLDRLFDPPLASNAEKRRRLIKTAFIAQERMLAWHVRKSHVQCETLARQVAALEQRLQAMEPERPAA